MKTFKISDTQEVIVASSEDNWVTCGILVNSLKTPVALIPSIPNTKIKLLGIWDGVMVAIRTYDKKTESKEESSR